MMPTRFRSWSAVSPRLLLFATLMFVYMRTLAPGLTWANGGSDGGDLIAAASTGGVPHPTGYPLYLLLARAFQLLPVGSLAYRTNLLSALATAIASVLVYEVVLHPQGSSKENQNWLAAYAAGCVFGLAPMIWSQAVITEVYGLHVMLVALIVSACSQLHPISKPNNIKYPKQWSKILLGLATGNHISALLITPAVWMTDLAGDEPETDRSLSIRLLLRSFPRQFGVLVSGLLIYLLIPLRALQDPPVNWGNAVTLQRFWWLVSGQLYRSYYLHFSLADVSARIQAAAAILLRQFGLPGVALALIGLIVYGKPSRLFFLTAWIAIAFTALAVIYGSTDSYVYLMPALLSFAIWIGNGLTGLSNQFTRWAWVGRIGLPLLLLLYLLARSLIQVNQVDASTDIRAERFGREVLSAAPENAILFAKGDQAVFALWYFHFALAERPDLAVVAVDLLHFDWYQETLHSAYPVLELREPFPWPETIVAMNASRAYCFVEYTDRVEMDCSQPIPNP